MTENFSLADLLKLMGEQEASDLHLQVGSRPFFRIGGVLAELSSFPVLTEEYLTKIIREVIPDKFNRVSHRKRLEATGHVACCYRKPQAMQGRILSELPMRQ